MTHFGNVHASEGDELTSATALQWSSPPICASLVTMRPGARSILLVLALVCACNARQDEPSGFGTPSPTTAPPGTTGSSSTSSSGGSSTGGDDSTSTSSAGSTSTGPVLDMPVPDFGQQHPIGCKGKIDFIFSISALGTMQGHQAQLVDAFPEFITAIEEQLSDFDVHILVADPDGGFWIPDCTVCTTSCDPQGNPPVCGAAIDACDKTIGAGVTFPSGTGATNRRCELASGKRYITSDESDLSAAFSCIAQVGIYGGSLTAEAMVNALGPELNGADGCNEGFLRDDALLVVTIINDGYDEKSAGTVDSWIKALRTAKHEDDDAFAVLVLTTDIDLGKYQLCHPDDWNQTPNPLRQLALGVDHGFVGSICEDSYGPFFAKTVAEIVSLCDGFVIPQ
jgi:hypothetical protein